MIPQKIREICSLSDPFREPAGYAELFAEAMRESMIWHAERSEYYRDFLRLKGVDPRKPAPRLEDIPFLPAVFFKSHEVLSIPREQVALHLTSSGTTGQKSQMFFDNWSLEAGQRFVDCVYQFEGFVTPKSPANYLLYSYETEPDSKLGTAYTDHFLCKYAPAREVFHALRRTGAGGHEFDLFGCIEKLQAFEKDGAPVRIFGFPAFLYFTLKRMRELKMRPLRLSPESLVFLGGGWKGNADQAVSKEELYSMITEVLGIPDRRARDSFGAVEHAIPYSECEHHHFHIPVWSRVIIRDVRTLQPLGFGQRGFLQFLTPYITSVPAQSVMMGDLASLHPGSECACALDSPFFVVHGRAGTSKNKSCAVAASELLGRS
jgi:phenylacetate-coenzyme A ligase PaaK-like adenylate-forming protein